MFILDVQGFQYGQEFLCKEIAIINVENGWYEHRIVKIPINLHLSFIFNFKKQCNWLTTRKHGLLWEKNENESLEYAQLSEFIKNTVGSSCIHVKGNQKKKWLKSIITNDVYDLHEEENCPSLGKLKLYLKSVHCNQHSYCNDLNCALENVFLLRNWYNYCKK